MADQVYPDEGLIQSLLSVLDNGGDGLTWTVFTNDLVPDRDSILTDFDLVADAWAKVILKAIDFTGHFVNLHVGSVQAPAITFTNGGSGSIDLYGYVAVDQVRNIVVLAARFDDAPVTLAIGAGKSLVPMVGDSSEVLTDTIDGGTF